MKNTEKRILNEGFDELEHDEELLRIANGIQRRTQLIERMSDGLYTDIETHLRYEHIVHKEELHDEHDRVSGDRDYYRGAWEMYFEKYLDTLTTDQLLIITERYLGMIESDTSAVQEYRICIQLLDRILNAGVDGVSFSLRGDRLEVTNADGKTYGFPLHLKIANEVKMRCSAVRCEGQKRYEGNDESMRDVDACRRIMNTHGLDAAYDIFVDRFGYNHELLPEQMKLLGEIIDIDIIATGIQETDIEQFCSYGFTDEVSIYDIVPGYKPGANILEQVIHARAYATESDRIQLSQTLGKWLGQLAVRAAQCDPNEGAFIITSGILDYGPIHQAFLDKSKEVSTKRWLKTDVDPIRDIKVKTLYEFTRTTINDADLATQMRWADYIDSPTYQLDMTRGGDPTIFSQGFLSGIPEHKAKSAGYEPGIYLGVLGAFYNWSDTHKAIIRNVPLKFVDDIRGRGEAIAMCKELHARKIDESIYRYPDGSVASSRVSWILLDASESEVIPYDAPDVVQHESIAHLDKNIPQRMLEICQRYYPTARTEIKALKTNIAGQSINLPFLVLPKEARENLVKVMLLKKAIGTHNIVIE